MICWLYHALFARTFHPGDKWLTHSVPGIQFLWPFFIASLVLSTFVVISSNALYHTVALLSGLMLGMVLHPLKDMCTRKGIAPLSPSNNAKVSGPIQPRDATDRRIAQFHFHHCSVAGMIPGFQNPGNWQGITSVLVCLFTLCSCLVMMIWSSDVTISCEHTRDRAAETYHRGMMDLYINQGKPDHSF